MRYNVQTHNYNGYAAGCRCDVCKAAKAAYMRDRRTPDRERNSSFTHGTRAGYEEHRCTCTKCRTAHLASDRRYTGRTRPEAQRARRARERAARDGA